MSYLIFIWLGFVAGYVVAKYDAERAAEIARKKLERIKSIFE